MSDPGRCRRAVCVVRVLRVPAVVAVGAGRVAWSMAPEGPQIPRAVTAWMRLSSARALTSRPAARVPDLDAVDGADHDDVAIEAGEVAEALRAGGCGPGESGLTSAALAEKARIAS